MSVTTALLDTNTTRACQLQACLKTQGISCQQFSTSQQFLAESRDNLQKILFLSADTPPYHTSGDLLKTFVRVAPRMHITLLSSTTTHKLIMLAIRERIWVDVPKLNTYTDLVQRYTRARARLPEIVVEDDQTLYKNLRANWESASLTNNTFSLTSSVGEAFELAITGRASVFLSLPPRYSPSSNISSLIYRLCPATIAILIKLSASPNNSQTYFPPPPASRFSVLEPPFNAVAIQALLASLSISSPSPKQRSPLAYLQQSMTGSGTSEASISKPTH